VLGILLGLVGTAACDIGHPRSEAASGPPPVIVATFPEDGAGFECTSESPEDCGVPRNAPVEIRFDRFLLPSTATRQSLRVLTRVPDLAVFLEARYDVVERVVSYSPYGGLWESGALHTVEITLPTEEFPDGFRAFDGAAVREEDGATHIHFAFRTARGPAPARERTPAPTCVEALDLFARSGCSDAQCHGGDRPAAGLLLDSAQGLADTAIRHVARETETGVVVGRPLRDPPVFGRQMPIIEPGTPSSSYLVYKLLANRANFRPADSVCRSDHSVAVEETCLTPSEEETARLRDAFVQLEPMPPGGRALASVDDLRQIVAYIEAGAPLDDCY
jgi:hypothetical protein